MATQQIPSHFLFGEGVFRTLLVEDGEIKYWKWHEKKLQEDCAFLALKVPNISPKSILQGRNATHGKWRLRLIIASDFFISLDPYLEKIEEKRLTIYPYPIVRPSAKIKSLSYLDHQLAYKYALKEKYDDAIIMNCQNVILECSRANILFFYQNTLFYMNSELPYYEGVMQKICLEVGRILGYNIASTQLTIEQIPKEAFLFTTNSLQGMVPVISIGNNKFKRDLAWEFNFRQVLNSL